MAGPGPGARYAAFKAYGGRFRTDRVWRPALFSAERPEARSPVIEADGWGPSPVTGRRPAGGCQKALAANPACSRRSAGCGGGQAETQVRLCMRAAVPTLEKRVSRTAGRQRNLPGVPCSFVGRAEAGRGESHRDAAARRIVVTITDPPSRDPSAGRVLQPARSFCAAGATTATSTASSTTTSFLERGLRSSVDDWLPQGAGSNPADLIEPVQTGVLDWSRCTDAARGR